MIKKFLNSPLFVRDTALIGPTEIIWWWEKRRLPYNIAVGGCGLITCCAAILVSLKTGELAFPSPPIFALFWVIAYGVGANICYTGGWITEIIVNRFWGEKAKFFGEITFKLGMCFSILLTLIPGVLFFIASLTLDYSGFTRTKPNEKDLVGIYFLNEQSCNYAEHVGKYKISVHKLELRDDGTFSLTNMPDWWLDSWAKSKGGFDSGTGKWSIEHYDKESYSLRVSFKEINGDTKGLGTSFFLRNEQPPYSIEWFIGDPDNNDRMVFEKENAK